MLKQNLVLAAIRKLHYLTSACSRLLLKQLTILNEAPPDM